MSVCRRSRRFRKSTPLVNAISVLGIELPTNVAESSTVISYALMMPSLSASSYVYFRCQ